MVREMITICIGQAGIQLSQPVWMQYCKEHQIGYDGIHQKSYLVKQGPTKIQCNRSVHDSTFKSFFEESGSGFYIPRNLMVDLEPNVIDDMKTSSIKRLLNEEFLLSGKEDAANNFARGHFTIGNQIIDKINDRIRKLVDCCDNVQGFTINHSVGGGTGSGLASLILQSIAVDYTKKSKIGFEIYPSPKLSTSVVEPYNALLTTHWLLDHTNISVVLDNEAIYELCQKRLDIERPSYADSNTLFAKIISSVTADRRYERECGLDLSEFETNLVPFPRLHFMIASMAPIATTKKLETTNMDTHILAAACFEHSNFLTKIADFDTEEDKYMAISAKFYNVKAKEANATIQWLKQGKKVSFVEWCPTGFKVELREDGMPVLDDDTIAFSDKNVFMMGNNTAISRLFSERISQKYDVMYSQRAFVHWYIGEGMEEGEFAEARQDLGFLEKDYLDVLCEQYTDEEEEVDSDEY